jgi:hypothetical protein
MSKGEDGQVRDVLHRLEMFRQEWKTAGAPNSPIDNYDHETLDALVSGSAILDSLSGSKLAERAGEIIESLRLPIVDDADLDHTALKVHWRVSRFQELMFEILIATSGDVDRPQGAKTQEVEILALESLTLKVDKISRDITEIRAGKKFGGMSISVLGISTPLDTIWKAIESARKALETRKIDSRRVQRDLELAYDESKSILERLSKTTLEVSGYLLGVLENLFVDVGEALVQALGIRARTKKELFLTMPVELNGSVTLDDLIEIRNEFSLVDDFNDIPSSANEMVRRFLVAFCYGLNFRNDTISVVSARIVEVDGGLLTIVPAFVEPSRYRKNRSIQVTKRKYLSQVARFFDTVTATLATASAFDLPMLAFEPVLSIIPFERASEDDLTFD